MIRTYRSEGYNYNFNTETGYFERWGKTLDEDPQEAPFPEILDFETGEKCLQKNCACYKSNKRDGRTLSFEDFKIIIDKMPFILQIAFGVGDLWGVPEIFKMMEYTRLKNIVPNITINGGRMIEEYFQDLSKYCGAVAVSNYGKIPCYGSVKKLTDLGMKQVNIHQLLSMETLPQIRELLKDINSDERLKNLNAVVFLSVKQKGRGINYHSVPKEEYKKIIDYCFRNNIRFGMDSCFANSFLNILSQEQKEKLIQYVEPCESTLMSSYVNVEGKFFPCSFAENDNEEGLDVLHCKDFVKDIWMNPETVAWRQKLLDNGRNCPMYDI